MQNKDVVYILFKSYTILNILNIYYNLMTRILDYIEMAFSNLFYLFSIINFYIVIKLS